MVKASELTASERADVQMLAGEILDQIVCASPGEEVVYHHGNFWADAYLPGGGGGRRERDAVVIAQARRDGAQMAHRAGFCELVQRRTGPETCAYVAQRTRKVRIK